MFVQSIEFINAHASGNGNGGRAYGDISIYGQESNHTTWRLAKMNLAIRGIEGQIAHGDTFHNDRHPDLRADYILANPPFNVSNWGGERLVDDQRWKYDVPPKGNANFAWVQHMVYHLAPEGMAGFVLANGSMSSGQSGEGQIRQKLVEADLVDCMVALPGQLFYSTQIPACLWFLSRDRDGGGDRKFRDRRGEILFIDARKLGRMTDRTHRELTDEDIDRIADTYHAWREGRDYEDVPGLLQKRYAGRRTQTRPCADARPVCGRGTAARGQRAVRREDAAARDGTARAAGGGRTTGCCDRGKPEIAGVRVGVWRERQEGFSSRMAKNRRTFLLYPTNSG